MQPASVWPAARPAGVCFSCHEPVLTRAPQAGAWPAASVELDPAAGGRLFLDRLWHLRTSGGVRIPTGVLSPSEDPTRL